MVWKVGGEIQRLRASFETPDLHIEYGYEPISIILMGFARFTDFLRNLKPLTCILNMAMSL